MNSSKCSPSSAEREAKRNLDFGKRTYCPFCTIINCKNGLAKDWVLTFKSLFIFIAINEKDMLRNVFGLSDFLCKYLLKPSA